jgi:hypothetical protein
MRTSMSNRGLVTLVLVAALAACGGSGKSSRPSGKAGGSSSSASPSTSGATTGSGVSDDLAAAHGIVTAVCSTTGDTSTTIVSVLDPHDGHVVARRTLEAPFGAHVYDAAGAAATGLCEQPKPERALFDAGYSHIVVNRPGSDGSDHIGMFEVASGRFTDLRAGIEQGGLAPVLHDGPPIFGPDGQVWFEEASGPDVRVVSVDPSTLRSTVHATVHLDQPATPDVGPLTITTKGVVVTPKREVGAPAAAACLCTPVPNPTGSAAAQLSVTGIDVFLPPEWHLQRIELSAAGQRVSGQRWFAGEELAWLDDHRFVCACLSAPAGGTGLAVVTLGSGFSSFQQIKSLLPDTDRTNGSVRPVPDGSAIAFVSNGHGEIALYTIPTGGGTPTRLMVLTPDAHLVEWR